MSKEKVWVFRSLWDFKLQIKSAQKKLVADNYGNNQLFSQKPVYLEFKNQFCAVNDALAQSTGMPKETLVEWAKMQPSFGKTFWLVDSPEEPADEVTKEEIKKTPAREKGPKVVHGPRSLKN